MKNRSSSFIDLTRGPVNNKVNIVVFNIVAFWKFDLDVFLNRLCSSRHYCQTRVSDKDDCQRGKKLS